MSMCTMARSVPLAGGLGDGASPASLAASASMRACHQLHILWELANCGIMLISH